jgi:Ser/Thr protein kinase RdoA (MazF antagonist)
MISSSFFNLSPDKVLQTCEAAGFMPTGEFSQLNSYENRVFDIKLENNKDSIIAKFYRPGRWSSSALMEEHDFLKELNLEGIPAVAPLQLANRKTLIDCDDMHVAFFPKIRARMPQELSPKEFEQVGILLARLHNVGGRVDAPNRPQMSSDQYGGWNVLEELEPWIASEVRDRYLKAAEALLNAVDDEIDPSCFQRIHGDCHKGNLLHTGSEFFLVDFDDFSNGPIIQDFWMLLSGGEEGEEELHSLIYGYEELREFPEEQLGWIPLLRGQRIINYAGWIAKRWQDPSFPRLFPDFQTYTYWAEEVEALEKIAWSL